MAATSLDNLSEGSRSSQVTAIVSDLFPGRAVGAITGAMGAAFGAGAAIFPWLAGWPYDRSSDYHTAFTVTVLAIVFLWRRYGWPETGSVPRMGHSKHITSARGRYDCVKARWRAGVSGKICRQMRNVDIRRVIVRCGD